MLKAAWAELEFHNPRERLFRTKRVSAAIPVGAHAGRRAVDNAPCLVIDAQTSLEDLFEVGGMRLAHSIGDAGPLLVLSLEDPARTDLFAMVCADALGAALTTQGDEALESFLARLGAWRTFLRERRGGLSQNETVGLIGELIVLRELLRLNPELLDDWRSPHDGLHDFAKVGDALEIKATLGVSPAVWISSLDQLDSTGLNKLHLVCVSLSEVREGECLADIARSVASLLSSEAERRTFENALLRRGLMPDDLEARTRPCVQIQGMSAFLVSQGFPRLSRDSVPSAITDANYMLELRALAPYSVDADSVIVEFSGGQPN
jgi:hypothetical protein